MNEIRHIVFDVGRVLIHYDPQLAYAELIADSSRGAGAGDLFDSGRELSRLIGRPTTPMAESVKESFIA